MPLTGSWIEVTFGLVLLALALWILIEDIRNLEIGETPVLGLAAGLIAFGSMWPLTGLEYGHALGGAALGLTLGVATRGYIHLRTGVPGFGGADIALICGMGGLLGPFLVGPWSILVMIVGLCFALVPGLGARTYNLDGEDVVVIPLCPAIIVTGTLVYALAWSGLVPATGLS